MITEAQAALLGLIEDQFWIGFWTGVITTWLPTLLVLAWVLRRRNGYRDNGDDGHGN